MRRCGWTVWGCVPIVLFVFDGVGKSLANSLRSYISELLEWFRSGNPEYVRNTGVGSAIERIAHPKSL
jgi:hypothetical protein